MMAGPDDKPMIDVQLELQLNQSDLSSQRLRTIARRLLGQLAELDANRDNAFDPAVHTRPGDNVIVVDLVVPSGGDALGCARHAMKVIRTAANAAGLPIDGELATTRVHACPIPVLTPGA